jgi:hypothetical protein
MSEYVKAMQTTIPIKELPTFTPADLIALQYRFHSHIHSYLSQGRDPIFFYLADMLLINAELLTRIVRATEKS